MTRKARVLAAVVALAIVATTGALVVMSGTSQAASIGPAPPTSTAKVEKQTLSAMLSLDGTLTYQADADGSPYSAINRTQGIYTELPHIGQVITRGQVLYRVDDNPVVLLYGSTPAYRSLSAGATGPDVVELNADLVALRDATTAELDPGSSVFGPATSAAVARLQAAVGLTPDGVLSVGEALFEPTAVRVTSLLSTLGGSAQIGQTVLQGSSTTRQVQVALDASQQTEVAVGDRVTITLPDNRTTPGAVSAVGAVATCPSGSGTGATTSGSPAPGSEVCSSGTPGTSSAPSITVDVTPADPSAMSAWGQAPVRVTITTASVAGALVVPVTALLAQAGGGYTVEVVDPHGIHRLAPVSLGLFDDADGLVQVSGSGLAAGEEVVVPSA